MSRTLNVDVEDASWDDWNKVVSGFGKDVAPVVIRKNRRQDDTQLKAALAENQFLNENSERYLALKSASSQILRVLADKIPLERELIIDLLIQKKKKNGVKKN